MKNKLISLTSLIVAISCSDQQTLQDQQKKSGDTSITISKTEYENLQKNQQTNTDNSNTKLEEVTNQVYAEPERVEPFIFETKIKINKSGQYIVPPDKIWDIKYTNGVNPLYGLDSTGRVDLDCGGFLEIQKSYDHECGVVENVAGEKFKSDKRQVVWYYLNSYPHLFVKEGHQINYKRGSSTEILNIDQYVIAK